MTEPLFYAELLQAFPVVVVQDVAWGDMDAYQHVNNVVYFRYFENARLEYLRRIGWLEMEKTLGVGPIVHSTWARFRRPLTYPDTIAIGARLSALHQDRFVLEHRIVSRQQKALATEGEGTVVSFHYREGRKADMPEALVQNIRKLESEISA